MRDNKSEEKGKCGKELTEENIYTVRLIHLEDNEVDTRGNKLR